MARKRHLTQSLFDNYLNESEEMKLKCQDMVFDYYWEKNQWCMVHTVDEIAADIQRLEYTEQYERCQMLKDILERIE